MTGNLLQPDEVKPTYWSRNMTSTVYFFSTIEKCLDQRPEINSIVEIGPHPALKGPAKEILRSHTRHYVHYFSTCKRDRDDLESILESAGEMLTAGMPLDLAAINGKEFLCGGTWKHKYGRVLTNLPAYAWNHSSNLWSESMMSRNIRYRTFPRHEFVGSRYVDDIPCLACWRKVLDESEIGWLAELDVSLFDIYENNFWSLRSRTNVLKRRPP